jgi:hypothetical protein
MNSFGAKRCKTNSKALFFIDLYAPGSGRMTCTVCKRGGNRGVMKKLIAGELPPGSVNNAASRKEQPA